MYYKITLLICLIIALNTSIANAELTLKEPDKARKIAEQMIDREDGKTLYSKILLVTCKFRMKNGRRSCISAPIKKKMESVTIDIGNALENTIMLAIIESPPSEKNLALLQKNYDEEGKESDQWMYFPALKKLKRIVSQSDNSPKTGSVFGSEIAYEDIEKMHAVNYDFSFEGNEPVDKRDCYKIAAYPRQKYARKTSYSKEIYWIDTKTSIPIKREQYNKQGQLEKTFFRKVIINLDGVWLNKVRVAVNHKSRMMSMEKFSNMLVNIPIEPDLAGLRALKDTSYRESKMRPIREKAK